jgi:hypothetical protein
MLTFATGYSDAEKGTTMADTVETSEAKPHDVGNPSPLTPAVGHLASCTERSPPSSRMRKKPDWKESRKLEDGKAQGRFTQHVTN